MTQSYLPKGYCWDGRAIQAATVLRYEMCGFMHRHPQLRVFSGFRRTGVVAGSDHLCGFALDLVPLTQDPEGKAALQRAEQDAKAAGYPYVELVWTAANKHLHISFKRCSKA